jgi:hypothetical protein
MYCGCCGAQCVIPTGYESDDTGVIHNIERTMYKVIRCVECANEIGFDVKVFFICVRDVPPPVKKLRVTDKQIMEMIFKCNGNKSLASRHLGITYRTVCRRIKIMVENELKSHGIDLQEIKEDNEERRCVMALPGETVGEKSCICMDCGAELHIKVCRSEAGYYIGFWCNTCGPYSRESGYYSTAEKAQIALDNDEYYR